MKLLCLLLVTSGIIACNGSGSTTTPLTDSGAVKPDTVQLTRDTISLAGAWFLLPVLPGDTGAGRMPQLIFKLDDKSFSGNTGCNSMSGSFDFTDSTITFNERIMLTKMACPGYNEQAFIKNLLRADRYTFQDSILVLKVEEQELSRWSRTPTKPPVSNKL